MERTVLIMAGGQGERFWPYSRKNLPKQFLCLTNEKKTMIQLTVDRVRRFTDVQHIFIVTNRNYESIVLEQLPDIPKENILCEPFGRNTAPCVALGTAHIVHKYGDALMAVLPSDHLVKIPSLFLDTLEEACRFAEAESNLLTIGITPSSPETGYGYIHFLPDRLQGGVYRVNAFEEKPPLETAKRYVSSGEYLWNSGMFIWKASAFLNSIDRYLPEMGAGFDLIRKSIGTDHYENTLEKVFSSFPSISIDYGILEKADNLYTIVGNFGWVDVGSWLSVSRIFPTDKNENSVMGNVILVDTKNSIVRGGSKLIAAVGLQNVIIVDTEDAALICEKEHVGDIPKILKILREQGLEEYL